MQTPVDGVVAGRRADGVHDCRVADDEPSVAAGAVRWPGRAATLRAAEVGGLVTSAERMDAVIERGRALRTGIERTFSQDPTMFGTAHAGRCPRSSPQAAPAARAGALRLRLEQMRHAAGVRPS